MKQATLFSFTGSSEIQHGWVFTQEQIKKTTRVAVPQKAVKYTKPRLWEGDLLSS